jgi:hypothetical protein
MRRLFAIVAAATLLVPLEVLAAQDIIATDTVPAVHKVCIASALGARLTP